jgi:DHA1 family multidrug resistance protein-like MFS transporter
VRDRSFLALCVLILVNQIGFGIITPVLPGYARSFGLGAGSVGLVIGIYGFARFLANVPAGQIAERRGRRQVLIIGTLITSLASALMATAGSLPFLLAYRLLAGLGAATVLTGGQIMVGDISTPENRGRMMSTYQGFFMIGVGLGPTPGGILADHFGLRAPFIAYAVFSALACLVALSLIRETRPTPGSAAAAAAAEAQATGRDGARIRSTLMGTPFLLIGAVSFVQFFARTGAVFTAIPLLGVDRAGLSASQIGYAMTAVNLINIATLYPSGQLADRLGRKLAIAPATIVCGLAMLLWAWSSSYTGFLVAAAVWGLGSGISGPSPAAYVADLAPADLRGRIFGYFRSVSDFGYIIGPLLIGAMIDRTGYGVPLMVTAAMFFGSGILFWLLAPEFHRAFTPSRASSGA